MASNEGVSWITASIAFPAATVVGTMAAGAIDLLFGTADNPWVRLAVAFVIVLGVTATGLSAATPGKLLAWIGAIALAVMNWLVLFAAMMGLPEARTMLVS